MKVGHVLGPARRLGGVPSVQRNVVHGLETLSRVEVMSVLEILPLYVHKRIGGTQTTSGVSKLISSLVLFPMQST